MALAPVIPVPMALLEISALPNAILWGAGNICSSKLKGSLTGKGSVNLSFTEPRFLDQNLAAGFDVFHSISDLTDTLGYSKTDSGGKLRLSMPLNDEVRLATYYRFSRREITEVTGTVAQVAELATLGVIDGDVDITSAVGYSLTYDTRNHFKKPTRGLYGTVGQEFAGVGGDKQYIRTVAEGRAYYPITDSITFASRLKGGHISGWGDKNLDSTDGFTSAADCVRGFEAGGFGPRTITGGVFGTAVGAEAYACATAEVRFPFPFIPDNFGISGAVFADAGMIFDPLTTATSSFVDDDTIRASVGGSVLWDSPMGPLRMDFAYALNKENYDETQVFSFGASSKF